MQLPQDVIDSIAQSIINELDTTDRWIQDRLENFFPLVWQVADKTNSAWLKGIYLDAKLDERGLLQHIDNQHEADDVYMRVADRVAELAELLQPPAIPTAPGLSAPPSGGT